MDYHENTITNNTGAVLVVEDADLNKIILDLMLRRLNHKVFFANDGVEALKLLKEKLIDLVITDIRMPNMDGFQLLKHIRQSESYKRLPVVMTTASGEPESQNIAASNGANAFLYQPFSSSELEQVIANCLE